MQKQLPGGLVLRTLSEGYATDRERLPQFYADVNAESDPPEVKNSVIDWTNDLIHRHPTVTLEDIFVVVDPAADDRIASATVLIPQTWRYEGLPVSVGRPELCGTYPDYQGRGLMRAIFEAVHERSAALGHQLQVITGIPYFYRRFGYTMAVDLGEQRTMFPLNMQPVPPPEYKPAFTLRPALAEDIPDMMAWYEFAVRGRLLTELRSPDEWRYEVMGHTPSSIRSLDYQIIVNAAGQGVGYLELYAVLVEKHEIHCPSYVVGDQASYLETFDDVMRAVQAWGTAKYGTCPTMLVFGTAIHESLNFLIEWTRGGVVRRLDYMWYLRVADRIPFLRHIQPVLEQRLEGSGAHRYSGELKIGFYDMTGIHIKFECGCISAIEPVKGKDSYDIAFPWHLLWNVVFGHHTADELMAVLPDVWPNGKAAVLLDSLFPRKKSWLKGLA